jgi:hypothetical protein
MVMALTLTYFSDALVERLADASKILVSKNVSIG